MLDRAAIGLSALCVAHCLAVPVLLVMVPSLAALSVADEGFHLLLLFLVLPTSIAALSMGLKRHGNRSVLLLGLTGVAVLVVAAIFGHDVLGDTGEKALTVTGAMLVAVSHVRNLRLCRGAEQG